MTQGARAVTSGNVLEKAVEGTLLGHGYVQVGFDSLPGLTIIFNRKLLVLL